MNALRPEAGPAHPERVRSGGKIRVSLFVLATAALVGLAVVKPWASPTPSPAPQPRQTASPPSSPVPTAAPPPPSIAIVKPDPLAGIDWNAMGATLRPHDDWGIRAIVYRRDNTLLEGWTAVRSAGADIRSGFGTADAYAIVGWVGAIAAIGITTPLDDLPLDVRVWRDSSDDGGATAGGRTVSWEHVAVLGITPTGDPSSRLLLLAPEWTGGSGWRHGEYEVDVLLESGVRHIHVWLDGEDGPIPVPPEPRPAPSQDDVRSLSSAPGAFIFSGTDRSAYLFAGLPQSDAPHQEHEAWLRPTSIQRYWPPGLAEPDPTSVGTANLIGATVSAAQVLVDARLLEIAPQPSDLGPGEILPGAEGSDGRPGAVVAFRPADPSTGFPDAVYRIDAHVYTIAGTLPVSWDVPVLTHGTSTESPLLSADREWADVPTDAWTLLIPGYPVVPVAPALPTRAPPNTSDTCGDEPVAGRTPPYIGIAHPGPAFASVEVQNLGRNAVGTPIALQSSQLTAGVLTLRPIGTNWLPGRYAALMQSGTQRQSITFCVH